MKNQNAFTLIEILVVVGILSLLSLVVFISVDPLTIFAESRNAKRWSDVNNLSTAIYRYIITNKAVPSGITNTEMQIGTAPGSCDIACPKAAKTCLDLSQELKPFIPVLPKDPQGGTDEQTLYTVKREVSGGNNVITVTACNAENELSIQITR